jgi:mRNA-degrading endonuclease toxin of MazEF toxin-antitoxin module
MKKNHNPQSKSQALRELVLSAEQKGLNLQSISLAAQVGYQRLRRIVKYAGEPTPDEAERIQAAVEKLARERAEGLSSLASV